MNRLKIFFSILLFLTGICLSAFAQDVPKTVVKSAKAKQMLLGTHRFSLQWISWDYFGKAIVSEKRGSLFITGEQKARKGSDYLKMRGVITEVTASEFKFTGTVEMRVSHINQGEICKREGELTFAIKGNRRYWRMQEMDNPCDQVTDYVDIFFK
ncbi:MAG: hypothetical protein AB1757_24210 [Acidobacteriota bacterium]